VRTFIKLSTVELKLLARDPLTLLFSLALPLVSLVVLGGVFGNQPSPEVWQGVGAMSYYVPAYVGLVIAALALISLPTALAGDRERGVLKRFHASGLPATAVIGAQVIVMFVVAVVSSLLLVGLAALIYDFEWPRSIIGVAGAFALCGLALAGLGVLLGAVMPTARAAQAFGVMAWFVLFILGGAGPPYEVMTTAMQRVADFTPLRHVVLVLHEPWLGIAAGWSWMIVIAMLVVGSGLGWRLFRWE
jgi:ABC-2 type transport system permease protein